MREFIYITSTPVANEPYTHRLIKNLFEVAVDKGFSIRLKVPDTIEQLRQSMVCELLSKTTNSMTGMTVEPFNVKLIIASVKSVLFFSSTLDYWRVFLKNPLLVWRCRKVLWFQGIESEESYYKHRNIFRRKILMLLESFAMKACNAIICPSDSMVNELLKRYQFLKHSSFVTIPNLADQIDLPEHDPTLWDIQTPAPFSLGYMGGLSQWQCFEETCRIVVEVQKFLPESWFLVLTRDVEKANNILRNFGVNNFKIRSAATEQTDRYIMSFNMGFMLRRDHIVNKVACPMKWLEYWRCGVPLITTRAVQILNEAHGAELNCIIDIEDPGAAAQQILIFARRSNQEHQSIRKDVLYQVDKYWIWSIGRDAIRDLFNILESTSHPHNYLWKSRMEILTSTITQ